MKDSKKKAAVLVRLPDSLMLYIEKLAEEQGDSRSSIVRQIIKQHQRLSEL